MKVETENYLTEIGLWNNVPNVTMSREKLAETLEEYHKIQLQKANISSWFRFDENFPKIGQKVQTKISFNTKFSGQQIFISESFEWVINETDKQKWLEAGLSEIEWKNCK